MEPMNDLEKGTKQTLIKQAHPISCQLRDKPTDGKSSGFVEEYPISEQMKPQKSLPRGQKAKPKMNNPSQSILYSPS